MIPPHYFAAQLQAAQRRVREGIQAVPTLDPDGTVAPGQQPDGYFNDCVLDLSRYLTSSDLPATPREFFDDLFHEKNGGAAAAGAAGDNPALNKPLSAHHHHASGGVIKVKEEPDSTATSRCSTPESLLPEHDFDNGDFPTPKFQTGNEPTVNVITGGKDKPQNGSLMCQLQSMQNSSNNHGGSTITTLNNNNNNNINNNNTDGDSNDSHSDVEMDMENLDINAQKLKAALAQLKHNNNNNSTTANREGSEYRFPVAADARDGGDGTPGEGPATPIEGLPDTMPHLQQHPHKNTLKSPRSKSRKSIEKGTDEYIVKRERNNVAVRKSRTKAKLKHIETQMRVGELTEENEQLRNRVASLQKELNALKSFISYNCPGNVKPPCFSSSTSYPPQQIFSTKIM